MKKLTQAALFAALAVSFPALAHNPPIVVFDAPGALEAPGSGTLAVGINFWGEIAGEYFDANGTAHGFIRTPDGTFKSFDPPGSVYTLVYGLNLEGAITGSYYDASFFEHGYLRASNGTFTSFDPAPSQGTESLSINDFGEISGDYFDAAGVPHGFVRSANGTITTYDIPGATLGVFPGVLTGLTANGTVSGDYHVPDGSATPPYDSHGYLRSASGKITSFDVPGAGDTFFSSINDEETVAGFWVVAHGDVEHGFVRTAAGRFTSFDVPGAGTGTGATQQGTEPSNINDLGVVVGDYLDANSVAHGFSRACDGAFNTFDAPGAGSLPFQGLGTFPISNNLAGAITGYFIDANGVYHGFLKP
jgi:hypothetical protein